MRVLKFGGSSVANAERIGKVKQIVLSKVESEGPLVVVVSAFSGVTDMLIDMGAKAGSGDDSFEIAIDELYYKHRKAVEELLTEASQGEVLSFIKDHLSTLKKLLQGSFLIKEISPRISDALASTGELLSSKIISKYIAQDLPETVFIDSRELIKTNSSFTAAEVDFEKTNQNISAALSKKAPLFVMGGFIASNAEGITTTLGRGGSDYSAAIMAAACDADELEIWTDVNGVMTADPRKVKKAYSIDQMTYEEAMEMSHFGAKVIHPPTIQPALNKNIQIRIKNTFEPEHAGTIIGSDTAGDQPVKGISSIGQVALINVSGSGLVGMKGFAGRLFNTLGRNGVNIILITQASSEHSICFAVKPGDIPAVEEAIASEFELEQQAGLLNQIDIQTNRSVIAVIGSNMKSTPGISGSMFSSLGKNGINIYSIAQGSSELNISVVIDAKDESKAIDALHQSFFAEDTKKVNLFLVGIGLIGGTLLQQIEKQRTYLKTKHNLEFNVIAVANSRKMLFDPNGIDISNFEERMAEEAETADLDVYVNKMIELNLPNSIFIENTASDAPTKFYPKILDNSISITTANKVANSASLTEYLQLREIAKKRRVKFFYETNVGASLPVITALNDLLRSGDEIVRIEAVLSGSLSFIFNSFQPGTQFSDIVKQAKEKGFTEPDPRDDLSGKDVARKALILCREMGLPLEMSDVEVESILPDSCISAASVDEFFAELKKHNGHFDKLRDEASGKGEVLRMLAILENGNAKVQLKGVDAENAFYGLQGSDNMIAFTTKRYNERPLVVKGPGAGAEVTAAGVFAEIIAISNYLS